MSTSGDVEVDPRGSGGTNEGASLSPGLALRSLKSTGPGLALVLAVAAVAQWLGGLLPLVGAPVIAIVLGVVLALVKRPNAPLKPGIEFASKKVLQASVVVLGLGLSLGQVFSIGAQSLPVLVGTLLAALLVAGLAGRALGLGRDVRTLIGVGTAICGASAIAATDAVIDADEADVSYAIATIFTFNVVAVLLYPAIGRELRFSQQTFGLWAGTAINDLSSVVAATNVYGHGAATSGVIVKLTRTLAILPICLVLAAVRRWRQQDVTDVVVHRRIELVRVLPLFIVAFIAAVTLDSIGAVPRAWHPPLANLSTWMITAALAAIGLSTSPRHIRRAGFRPLVLGAVLWLTVGLSSLGLQALTGSR